MGLAPDLGPMGQRVPGAGRTRPPLHTQRGLRHPQMLLQTPGPRAAAQSHSSLEPCPGAHSRPLPWQTPSALAHPRAADTPRSSRSAPRSQGSAAGASPRRLAGRGDRLGRGAGWGGAAARVPRRPHGRPAPGEGRVHRLGTRGPHVHGAEAQAEPPARPRRGCARRFRGAAGCGR